VRDQDLMLAGLRRLLAEPGAKLFGGGRSRGVFPQRTVAAERAAALLVQHGYLEADDAGACRMTPLGVKWLAENDEVKVLLEDVLRSAETQRERLESIAESCLKEATRLAQQRMAVSTILARMGSADAGADVLDEAVLQVIQSRHHVGKLADCSVADLFHALEERGVEASIGRFHDSLRRLREAGQVRLAPWTGPLYELPEPALALLIGHEVLYYVRPQHAVRAA
jgi:Fe2+ or Zn2+ uptake regulation protein